MSNRKYIIKNLAPWMMDELIAFSNVTTFDIIFLREQDEFYEKEIQELITNNINIFIKPFSVNNFFYKLWIVIKLLFLNFFKFRFDYNGAIGIKSIWWFLFLDMSIFSNNSNIHAQFATQPALVSLLIKKYYKNKPRYSFTFHAYDIYFENEWFNMLVENCYKSFSISNFNIKYVQKKYIFSNKIVLSRLGVFRNRIKKENKKESNEFIIGLMSWFTKKKGIEYLLESFKVLKEKEFKNIKLKLAGDGPLKDDILNFINENNLTNLVEYVGKIKGKEKDKFYNLLDVFILPSVKLDKDQDGIPVVLMEAIAYELPIISTNVSGIPEICVNNYNGFLLNEKNTEEIVKSIIDMFGNRDKIKIFSKNALLLSENYDIEINSKKKMITMGWI